MNKENIIEVAGLCKTYPGADKPAVAGINLAIGKGSFFGLLGPNGAGKTTFLSMLVGLLKPSSGKLLIAGLDIQGHLDVIKQRIGLVPQDIALYPTLTARENLAFFGSMLGLSGSRLDARIEECLDIADLNNFAGSRVEIFSGGLKRRLSLVIGLIHNPDILFLDEPTVGIDPQSRHFIYNSLRRMNADGMTIVYTSHYMEEVEQLCNDIAIIDHGRIIARGGVEELLSQHEYNIIKVRTADEIPAALQEKIMALPYIQESRLNKNGLTIKSNTPQQALLELVSILQQNNISIISLSAGMDNLEQVFLALTGTTLRE